MFAASSPCSRVSRRVRTQASSCLEAQRLDSDFVVTQCAPSSCASHRVVPESAAMAADSARDAVEDDETTPAAEVDKTAGEQGKALDTLTDVVEERVISTSGNQAKKVQEAMARLIAEEEERAKAQRSREKELAAFKLKDPADVDLVASELELDKKLAERRLREHGGDVLQALRSYVHE